MTDLLASVVVAVRRDPRARRLLASLACQTVPRQVYEVIVVENGSADLADTEDAYGIVRYVHLSQANSAPPATPGWASLGDGSCCSLMRTASPSRTGSRR